MIQVHIVKNVKIKLGLTKIKTMENIKKFYIKYWSVLVIIGTSKFYQTTYDVVRNIM